MREDGGKGRTRERRKEKRRKKEAAERKLNRESARNVGRGESVQTCIRRHNEAAGTLAAVRE